VIAGLLVSRIAIGAAIVGAVGLGAAIIVPVPTPPARVWFDQPLDGSLLAPGEHSIRLHLRDDAPLVRLIITRDGQQVGVPGDDSLERLVEEPGRAAWMGEFVWTFEPGTYVLQPLLGSSDTALSSVTITVVDGVTRPPSPIDPAPLPTATPSATPTPTVAPTPQPSAEPSVAPTTAPSPTPTPTPSPSAPPVFAGTVSRTPGPNDWVSTFTGSGISPAGAIVDVQVNVRNDDTGSFGGWVSTPCITTGGATTPFTCTVSNHVIPTYGRVGAYAPSYLVVYRLAVTYQGTTYYGTGGNWMTAVRIG